jgi:hypothetical protein
MATYKGIQGYTVQNLSSDPTASEAVGQLWYNSTSGSFKIGTQGAAALVCRRSFTYCGK